MSESHSDALVFFGATGDLAYKKIFPALQGMVTRGHLDVPVIGVAKSGWDLDQFRARARDSLEKHGGVDPAAAEKLYSLLRYGVDVKIEAGKVTEKVHLINWAQPEKNDFAIAEEVTLRGNHERRPDLVLYVNGIAIAVIELKNSRVTIGDGIRQLLSNQQPEFNSWFFSTVQLVFAGNDSEGLQYGTILTPEIARAVDEWLDGMIGIQEFIDLTGRTRTSAYSTIARACRARRQRRNN